MERKDLNSFRMGAGCQKNQQPYPLGVRSSEEGKGAGDWVQSPKATGFINHAYGMKPWKKHGMRRFGELLGWEHTEVLAGCHAQGGHRSCFLLPSPYPALHTSLTWLFLRCTLYNKILILTIVLSWVLWDFPANGWSEGEIMGNPKMGSWPGRSVGSLRTHLGLMCGGAVFSDWALHLGGLY